MYLNWVQSLENFPGCTFMVNKFKITIRISQGLHDLNTSFREFATESVIKKMTDTNVEHNGTSCPSRQSSHSNYSQWQQ
jgi:hypothetical protein